MVVLLAEAVEEEVLVRPNVRPEPLPEAVADDPPPNEKPAPALAAGGALDAPNWILRVQSHRL